MSRFRVGMCGLASENCTFSPAKTTRADFIVLRGEAQLVRYPFLNSGSLPWDAIDFIPLLHARALPGGVITGECYRELKSEILTEIQAQPLDAIYLDLHGAMHVEGLDDAEGDLVGAVRSLVGERCLIGASMDLHGNVSGRLVSLVDLFSAFRTAPHVDEEETREKVCRLIARCLVESLRPHRAWVPIPVLLPGEMTSTMSEPGRSLYEGLRDFDDLPGLLDVSLWVGYVWADERRAHATVVATALEPACASSAAEAIAQRYWDARREFVFGVPAGSISDCLDWSLQEKAQPILISDSGDNPTAGGVGNLTVSLRALLARPFFVSGPRKSLVAGLWDPAAVSMALAAGEGAEISLRLGQDSDAAHGGSLSVAGTVGGSFSGDAEAGRQVLFHIGAITVILTERRKPFHYLSDFQQLQLDPESFALIIVKIGYLVPDLEALAKRAYLALTPGAVDQHVTRLAYRKIPRPTFPFDADFEWKPRATVYST